MPPLKRTLPVDAILLFGMPRSGTTWIGKIFDSHPDTLYRHEPDTASRMANVPLFVSPEQFEDYRVQACTYAAQIPSMRHSRVAARLPLFPKSYVSAHRLVAYRLGAAASKLGARLRLNFAVPFAPTGQSCRLVWKSIESLGRLGLLMHCLPDARAIHIIRHPCGYVNSVLRGEKDNLFTHGDASEDYGIFSELCKTEPARRHGITVQQLRGMVPCERLAWRWVLYNETAVDQTTGSDRTLRVSYEELCAGPMIGASRMFDFCGLAWSAQTERFVTGTAAKSETSYYSIFKDPLASASKWRSQLAAEDVTRIIAVARRSALFSQDIREVGVS